VFQPQSAAHRKRSAFSGVIGHSDRKNQNSSTRRK
jgi:hypothetical protein